MARLSPLELVRRRGLYVAGLLWAATIGGAPAAQQMSVPERGVVVDAVQPGSVAALAGLRVGDVVHAWRRGDAVEGDGPRPAVEGVIASPWDLEQLAAEVAPRTSVTLSGVGESGPIQVTLPARTSRLGLDVVPRLDTAAAAAWRAAAETTPDDRAALPAVLAALPRSDLDWLRVRQAERLMARAALEAAATQLRAIDEVTDARSRLAIDRRRFDLAVRQSRWDDATTLATAALDVAGDRTVAQASWHLRRAAAARQRGRAEEAVADAQAALAMLQAVAPRSGDEADAHAELARTAVARRQFDEAGTHLAAALAILDAGPATVDRIRVEFAAADLDWRRGRLEEAERRVRRLLDLTRDLDPEGVDHARNLNLLGIVRSQAGDLAAAQQAFDGAWAIHRRRAPGGVDEASALNNLGIAAMQRGRYADAESFYRRSLAMKERLKLPPGELVSSYGNLGLVSIERRDLVSAREHLTRALDLLRPAGAATLQTAGVLSNLARAERLAGQLDAAERLARESLEIRSRLAPDSVLHAFTLAELGRVLEAAGRFDDAVAAHEQALAIRERLSPDGSTVADSLDALGAIAVRRQQLDEARRLYGRAGSLWERVAPGSVYEGRHLVAQARLERRRGQVDAARAAFARAIDIFDALTGTVGGAFDTQADFRESLVEAYAEYAALLVERGEIAAAFQVAERGRTRVFLAQLAERDVAADAPAALAERRRALARSAERLQAELASLSPTRDATRVEERLARLRDVRLQLAAVGADIARQSTRSLTPAEPLSLEAAQRLLPPDTAALVYLVGRDASYGFALTTSRVESFAIPLGREALAERVARFERLTAASDGGLDAIAALGGELHAALVAPAAPIVGRTRLLVVPDGPLHRLPFAALVAGAPAGGRPRYLVESTPVHQVASLTVYGQLTTPPAVAPSRAHLLAVGDPPHAGADAADTPAGRGPGLLPLPGTRREVEALGALYRGRVTTLLGADASEAKVRAALGDADIVHLAVHGLVNSLFPLDSALAFAPPSGAGDDGLLQAWEVFEQVRVRARLVVLSACETAGARESGGEGLLGLTRAFQFAGAPSVVASLWRVPDSVTPDLMAAFHRGVREGRRYDDALAGAQRTMLGRPATAHPYYWAAFVLSGRH
ncbi:MAG: CHAT domain-containing protein [Vicinamibacterales bacterium]